MPADLTSEAWLSAAVIDPEVTTLRADYRALLIVIEGLQPGPGDEATDRLLTEAERVARARFAETAVGDHPHVSAWQEAFRAAGMKPQRNRPSVEALLRRLDDGLPRIDRLTDVYNAISIAHVVPVGGEDLDRYQGPARLTRATGEESFDTVAKGRPIVEPPRPGEVVWRDDLGVTCRRWNWRQCARTRLTADTARGLFILDALGPMDDEAIERAGRALIDAFRDTNPGARATTRLVTSAAGERV
ncbi:MAG: B3/B4 domain-containing protein [Thermoanaerobaculia bacterium]